MKHIDAPSMSLAMAVTALMNQSSGSIEDISREVLGGVAAFLQNQGSRSDCGGLNSPEGLSTAAAQEYQELIVFRKRFDDAHKVSKDLDQYLIDLVKKSGPMSIAQLLKEMSIFDVGEFVITKSVQLLLTRHKLSLNDYMLLEVK